LDSILTEAKKEEDNLISKLSTNPSKSLLL